MKSTKLAIAAVSAFMMCVSSTALAGSSHTKTTRTVTSTSPTTTTCTNTYKGGTLCRPGKPVEKIVPEYYDVPSKTKHIHYDKPNVKPVTTTIIHHVPVPVYGRQTVTETVQGGQWTGPAVGGCCGTTTVRTVTPTVRTVVPTVRHVPAPRPCRTSPPSRYGTGCR